MTPHLRFALALLVGGTAALLVSSLMGTSVDASVAILAALVVTLAASLGVGHVATAMVVGLTPPPRSADGSLVVLAGRVTDPVHHPIRPRAPGMA